MADTTGTISLWVFADVAAVVVLLVVGFIAIICFIYSKKRQQSVRLLEDWATKELCNCHVHHYPYDCRLPSALPPPPPFYFREPTHGAISLRDEEIQCSPSPVPPRSPTTVNLEPFDDEEPQSPTPRPTSHAPLVPVNVVESKPRPRPYVGTAKKRWPPPEKRVWIPHSRPWRKNYNNITH